LPKAWNFAQRSFELFGNTRVFEVARDWLGNFTPVELYPDLIHLVVVGMKRTRALDLPNPADVFERAVMFSENIECRTFLIVQEVPERRIVHFLLPSDTSLPVILLRDETEGNSIVTFTSTKLRLRKIPSTTRTFGLPGTRPFCGLAKTFVGTRVDDTAIAATRAPIRRKALKFM
jgi:hypothetical protein